MIGPLDSWLRDKASARADSGLRRRTVAIRENSVDLASNDYLGLSRDPRVVGAAAEALHRDSPLRLYSPAGMQRTPVCSRRWGTRTP